ncbi:MAG: MoaD/ThiS family protein [Desulfohalobiaceae bacterium]|nr:MoaD/ThiS family protein [Desulfohalobiaceae bacterium]
MRLTITLLGDLKRFAPGHGEEFELDLESGADIADLLQHLGLGSNRSKIVLVNGRQAREDRVLADADHVTLLPAVEGG